MQYTFDLDQLPVFFGASIEIDNNEVPEFKPLNQAIVSLVDLIREAGKHSFRLLRVNRDYTTREYKSRYYYCCSQDSSKVRHSKKRASATVAIGIRMNLGNFGLAQQILTEYRY